MHPPRFRSARGQAGTDYVGVIAIVGVALAVAVAVIKPPPIPASITSALRHAICLVGGGVCTPSEAREAGLDPCVVHVSSDSETVGAVVAVVRLRRGDTAVVERSSDGTATVSFLDSNVVGAHTGVGLRLGAIAAGDATAAAGVAFNTGREYRFDSWAQAGRFLARHAGDETTVGEGLDLARRLSPAHDRRRRPTAQATSYETGTWMELEADLAVPLPVRDRQLLAGAQASAGRVMGRRRHGTRTTWYLRVEGTAAAQLGMVVGSVTAGNQTDVVLEVTVDHGRPVTAAVRGTTAIAGELDLYGQTTDLATLARRLRAARSAAAGSARSGASMEASIALDLTVAANSAAVLGVLDVLRLQAPPADWPATLSALGERLDSEGRIDLSVYRSAATEKQGSAHLMLGAGIGVERVSSRETRQLVAAWSAVGAGLREREDCLT